MGRTKCIVALGLAAAGLAVSQPSVSSISNAASYAAAPVDGNGNAIGSNNVAQGSIFVLFGSGMGPGNLVQASGTPLPTTLPASGGTSISISSGGQNVAAFLIYTFDQQVAAILPSNTPLGAATVTVTYNGQTSKPLAFNVVPTQLGIFTRNAQGNGPAIAQIFTSATSVSLMGLSTPVQPGQAVVLYGTGLGAINGPDNVAPGVVSVGSNVTVNVAGVTSAAAYAGRSPDFPGLDQVNFIMPADAPTGCYIPAEITASGRPSNLIYLSISSGGACTHPYGLPAAALQRLDTPGGTVNTGMFLLLRAVVLGLGAEGAGGLFETVDANAAFQLYNRIQFAFGGYNFPVANGSCAVLDTIDPPAGFNVPDFTTLQGKELKGADFLNLAGPNNASAVIPRMIPDTGGYLTVFFSTLGQGTWTLSGPAGPDVGAFSAKTDLPDDLVWTNAGNFANPPRNDLTITWSGGNLKTGQAVVTVVGASVVVNPSDPSKSRGAMFFCNAPASAGRTVVPAAVTQRLPSSNGLASGEVYFGQLGIYSGGGSTFQAPLTSGAALDGAFLAYGEAHTLSVKFQ